MEEEIYKGNKYRKKCFVFLVISEVRIKNIMRYIQLLKFSKFKSLYVGEDVD